MSFLVLGNQGFLGSYICEEFEKLSIKYIPINKKEWKELIKIDFKNWLIENQIKKIIFCCGYNLRFNPEEIDSINELEIISFIIKNSNCKIIYLSSSLVYGANERNNSLEEIDEKVKASPSGAYGMYKRILERIILNSNPNNCILRLVSCIGYRKKSGLFKSIENQLRKGNFPIKMLHGNTTRDYLWVGYAAKLIVQISLTPEAKGIYNLGSGKGIKVSEIIKKFATFHGINVNIEEIQFGPLMPEDPVRLVLNIEKIKSIIRGNEFQKIFKSDQIDTYLKEDQLKFFK